MSERDSRERAQILREKIAGLQVCTIMEREPCASIVLTALSKISSNLAEGTMSETGLEMYECL